MTEALQLYEVTIKLPNGDWQYWRGAYVDFQAACEAGISRSKDTGRLIRVEKLAD